jgi:hypothetical protein
MVTGAPYCVFSRWVEFIAQDESTFRTGGKRFAWIELVRVDDVSENFYLVFADAVPDDILPDLFRNGQVMRDSDIDGWILFKEWNYAMREEDERKIRELPADFHGHYVVMNMRNIKGFPAQFPDVLNDRDPDPLEISTQDVIDIL